MEAVSLLVVVGVVVACAIGVRAVNEASWKQIAIATGGLVIVAVIWLFVANIYAVVEATASIAGVFCRR